MSGIDEFAREFFQEIVTESDADGQFMADVFFERFCDELQAAGDLETADRAFHLGAGSTGIRVDGYGGDPDDNGGLLSLIVADFNQSPEVGRLVASEMDTILQRPLRFLKKALDPAWRNGLEETSPGFGLADLIAQRWSRIDRVRILLISNRELSERVEGRDAEEIDGRPVTHAVWDLRRLHRFVTVSHGREDMEIDLEADFGGAIPILPAHLQGADYQSYLAVVPGPLLADIYDRWGARLLEQNVRVFLQAKGGVNKGIRQTLETDPAMFFAYNNGLTATAEAVRTESRDGQIVLTGLRNLQIVNGGQTTASIHAARRAKVDLSRVFVQMKLSIVDQARAGEIVPRISEYANSQNRVNAADFFANHPFHVRMQGFSRRMFAPSPDGTFRETKWFYERARGQHADARALLTPAQRKKFDLENPRAQVFSKTDLAKYQNAWGGKPDKVSLGAQKNFADFAQAIGVAWKKDEDGFNEGWFREAVAKAILFRAAEKIVSEQSWYEGGYRANIVAYATAKMAHDLAASSHSLDFAAIWQKQAIDEPIRAGLAVAAKAVHDVLVTPPDGISNVTEWAKKQACWARVQSLKVAWPRRFLDAAVSADDTKEQKRDDRRVRRALSGIEAQKAVLAGGGPFWREALEWGRGHRALSETEAGILSVASQIPSRLPSEAQSVKAMQALEKLRAKGFAAILPGMKPAA